MKKNNKKKHIEREEYIKLLGVPGRERRGKR